VKLYSTLNVCACADIVPTAASTDASATVANAALLNFIFRELLQWNGYRILPSAGLWTCRKKSGFV
jgi:hypothetical protein